MSAPRDRFCNRRHAAYARGEGTEAGRERRCRTVAPRGPWRRAALVGLVTVALALSAAPARADDPVAAARAQARAAEGDVRALQARVQAADASYATALDGLSNAVTSQVEAERIADDATLRAEAASRAQRQHLLQVYLSGGTNVLDLTLTDGPVAASQGSDYLMRLVERDRRAVTLTQVEQKRAVDSAASMDRRASAKIETVNGVQDRYDEIQTLLDEAQSRLQKLNATARSLAQVQALIKELDAQKAAADAARLAAAKRARAGGIPAGLPRALPSGRADLPRPALGGSRRHRPGRERPRIEPQRLLSRRAGPDAVPARHVRCVRGGR